MSVKILYLGMTFPLSALLTTRLRWSREYRTTYTCLFMVGNEQQW